MGARQRRHPRFQQRLFRVRQVVGLGLPTQQMVECQHTVRLTAAEGRLQLDDRLATLSRDTFQRLHQESPHAGGDIGSREKLHRVLILHGCRPARYLREVRGELRVAVGPIRHVRMGLDYLTPTRQPGIRLTEHLHAVFLVDGALGLRRKLLHGGGTIGRTVKDGAHHCGKPRRAVCVESLTETRHRIQCAARILAAAVLRALVGQGVPRSLELLAPVSMVDAELTPEDRIPLVVEELEAALQVQ